MSNQEPTPGNSQSSTPEQLKHSGKEGYEYPVREYKETPLSDAPLDYDPRSHEGDMTTEHIPEDLRVNRQEQPAHTANKPEKLSVRQKILRSKLGKAVVFGGAGIVAISTVAGLKIANDTSNAIEADRNVDTNNSAPAVPGEVADAPDTPTETSGIYTDPETAGFYGEVPAGFETPIILSDADAATLKESISLGEQGVEQSEVYGRSKEIFDENLMPVFNAALAALVQNGGTAEGLNFSNVINDKNTIAQLEEVVAPYTQYGTDFFDNYIVQICNTLANEDGSTFCGPLQGSGVAMNTNITLDMYTQNPDTTNDGLQYSFKTAMQPRIYENKLILATDGAIRNDF